MSPKVFRGGILWIAGVALGAAPIVAQQHQHPLGDKLGTVHFQTSCTSAAQAEFDRAMAFLHSFEFGPAIAGFTATAKTDPTCAIAHWGIAISRWTNPFAATIRTPAQIQQGLEAIRQAERIGAKTPRERAYIAAVATLYADAATLDQMRFWSVGSLVNAHVAPLLPVVLLIGAAAVVGVLLARPLNALALGDATATGLGGSPGGQIDEEGDEDWFTFALAAQTTVEIETTGATDTYGSLYDAAGQRLEIDDDDGAGANFRIARTLGAGRYYVRVERGSGEEESYTLTLDEAG